MTGKVTAKLSDEKVLLKAQLFEAERIIWKLWDFLKHQELHLTKEQVEQVIPLVQETQAYIQKFQIGSGQVSH